MNDFYRDISSWWWWVSFIFLALFLNIIASYLREMLDKYLNKLSIGKRRIQPSLQKILNYYQKNDLRYLELKQDINNKLVMTILSIILSLFIFNFVFLFPSLLPKDFFININVLVFILLILAAIYLVFPIISLRKILDLIKVRKLIIERRRKNNKSQESKPKK